MVTHKSTHLRVAFFCATMRVVKLARIMSQKGNPHIPPPRYRANALRNSLMPGGTRTTIRFYTRKGE